MTRATRSALLAGLLAASVAAVVTAPPSAAKAPTFAGPFEQQLTFDDRYAQGEPSIAVNPKNPRNIIVTFLVNTGFGVYGAENGKVPPESRTHEQTIQGCDYLLTFDGGATWKQDKLPITNFQMDPTRPNCSDTLVLFDRHGVAYVVGSNYQFPTFIAGQGDFRLISSRDGGRTWSKPSVVSPAMLGPGSDPAQWQGARFYDDREFMALDASTGVLHVNGTQGRADAEGSVGNMEYLATSRDGGKTWEDAIAVGNAHAVQLAAAHGIVALTSPTAGNSECSCDDFVVSTDGGRSIKRYTTMIPAGSSGTVADPRHKGRFAVVAQDDGKLVVYVTKNSGKRFQIGGKIPVGGDRTAKKLWLDWSPQGVLGIGWRATTSGGSYSFFGAVSYDDGRTFTVHKLSKGDSPTNDPAWVAGDDTSAIWLTKDRFYAVWGDWRGGSLQTWWGGFPLKH
jgi:hypothetical protein